MLDTAFLHEMKQKQTTTHQKNTGACITCLFSTPDTMHVAHIGDTRAVLYGRHTIDDGLEVRTSPLCSVCTFSHLFCSGACTHCGPRLQQPRRGEHGEKKKLRPQRHPSVASIVERDAGRWFACGYPGARRWVFEDSGAVVFTVPVCVLPWCDCECWQKLRIGKKNCPFVFFLCLRFSSILS